MKINSITNILLTISIFVGALFLSACSEEKKVTHSKKIVALSTFVLYDIAKHISQNTLELVRIIPAGVDIHSFEPSPKTMAKIEKSDLVFYNGAGLEPWISSFVFKNRSIGVANYIPLKSLQKNEPDAHEQHIHTHQCSHSSLDPHIWFDIENMKRITDIITYEFIALEPNNKDLYLRNRDMYVKMLSSLEALHQQKLRTCKLNTIVTNHNAFSYLSDKYNFNVKTLSGLSPDSESSPKDIIRVIKNIEEFQVPVVFYENFGSDKEMKNIAKQANVHLDSLHPLGNITKNDDQMNRTYQNIMIENLNKLSRALLCQ